MMTGGASNMLTSGAEGNELIWRSTDIWVPFAIDAKGGEKLDERGSMILTEHELLHECCHQ